jgi:hypothetical protein
MNEVTYRLRAAGPGMTKDEIRARLLAFAGGSIVQAFEFACHDLSEALKGGLFRLRPTSGDVELKTDDQEPVS